MAFPIERKIVIAVSSSAVFNMQNEDRVFRDEGEKAYRQYQRKHLNDPFDKGVAYPFISRLLRLNDLFPQEEPIEVVVLSRNDPDSGRRFFESCKHYGLNITRGAFLLGSDPYPYVVSFNAVLFLSANEGDVRGALDAGMPAGLVLPTVVPDDDDSYELRIAFDFDGVLAGDESEHVFQEKGLEQFHRSEQQNSNRSLQPGPFKRFAKRLAQWQRVEARRQSKEPSYRRLLRIAIVTSRNVPSHTRLVKSIEDWGLTATETFFMGGIDKGRVLRVFRPHLVLDDQRPHLEGVAGEMPCVFVPFGRINDQN